MKKIIGFFSLVFLVLVFVFSSVAGEEFSFAWLTDTHISENETAIQDLQTVVNDINQLDTIDFIIVSGDITEADIGENLIIAKSILDKLEKPYYIIPGNHDTKWSDSGGMRFIELWGDDKFEFDYGDYKFIGMHQGPIMRMADGHFNPDDLRWLDSLLVNMKNQKQSLILVTHYPIDQSIDNCHKFLETIQPYNVKLFLHGHGHRNRLTEYAGIPGVMGRSTLRRNAQTGGYTIATVDQDTIFFFERIPGKEIVSAWAVVAIGETQYNIQEKAIHKPDDSINEKVPHIQPKWIYDTGYCIASTPVYRNGLVFAGDGGGNFYALDMNNGKRKWTFETDGPIFSTPCVQNKKVVFASADHFVYCLNTENGKLIWSLETDSHCVASPVIHDNTVFIGGSDQTFRAIILSNGEIIWTYDGIQGFVETIPLIYKDLVIFGAWDERLYALDKEKGDLEWQWSDGRDGVLYSPAACWPVAANNKVFIVAPDRFMTAIDYRNGQTVWRSNRFTVRETIGISQDGSQVYAECMRDTVFSVSSKTDNYKLLWEKDCGYGYDIAPSMLMEKENTVFFATKNGLIFALHAATGNIEWIYKFGNTLINTVYPIDSKRLLFSNMDGKVVLLVDEKD